MARRTGFSWWAFSRDKKADEIVARWRRHSTRSYAPRARHKGADGRRIAAAARKANPEATIQIAATIEDAVAVGHSLAISQKRKIYVARIILAVEYATVAGGSRGRFEVF